IPLTCEKCLVVAFMTSVLLLAGLLAAVQPSSRLSCGPTVMPFGPQSLSCNTPVFVAGLKAPSTMVGRVMLAGSITIIPPSQVAAPEPPGLPRIGTDAQKRFVFGSHVGCWSAAVPGKATGSMVILLSIRTE